MRILISSYFFYPHIGGIERTSLLLAEEFVKRGNEVKIITYTPSFQKDNYPFEVIRHPRALQLVKLVKWAEIFFHNNISLKSLWPLVFIRRPLVITHQTWIINNFIGIIKRSIIKYAYNISISKAIAEHIGSKSIIIPNPYEDKLFYLRSNVARTQDIIFVGRLVKDKGVEVLLKALIILKKKGINPTVSIIGEGPEKNSIKKIIELYSLNTVKLKGKKTGEELAEELNTHKIMVVPSLWAEPFGIVALEGIACGCVVVGSERGGIKEAIGPCGKTFPNGDEERLAEILEELLKTPEEINKYLLKRDEHLQNFTVKSVASKYLKVFKKILK